ncbi:hypothetical protein MJO28_001115 [Puccinia striiformis f. sp. tritici]|uniref:Uncharacterized protein n=4 Tax=Puccinia striiformis TaxID=27350 RepID=A0A0L0VBD7_9BASI|nr:hypothetical protein Pst134EA_000124 [Puccinia striiformis f. sp. tritici]XP_047812514.1 hypothetical protein Pst134EA_000139 [Puccinia striiformis f. sp. tritici]KNE96590.1 hypothetical protein PSTG_10148 [Puccinia striiformis f. sp. tritici PST-78]POW02375.1 hypothetical protein PSTT_11813 [Puccinia striiformis]KAH9466262.1 hypothetical protein Pst134EB_001320 [Puccinia striiformis f. sp. tritici]KAH9473046.1 hypothetical protein Pst134EA_000124 [Puccinia striiformis f. sp. tritici]KAH94
MIFLAGLLNRSSLSFILVSVVRLISIIAILFAFAMNLYLIVINIQGVHHHLQEVSADSGSQKRDLSHNTTNASSLPPATSDCGYINGTNVPTTFGGILFFVLGQVFNMIILILCLLSELSFPPLPKFFQVFFPPLGQSFGVGFLGSLEVYIACNLLSHHINKTSRAAFWLLFVIGLINVVLGVILGRRIRSKRSLLDAGTAYAKKATHLDDIETGFSFAQKGAKRGKKAFKNLKPSMISKPQATSQNPFQTPDTKSVHHPLEISRPIIDYIQQRKAASATANPNHPEHSISLPAEPSPIYSSFKTIVSEHSKRSKDTLHS